MTLTLVVSDSPIYASLKGVEEKFNEKKLELTRLKKAVDSLPDEASTLEAASSAVRSITIYSTLIINIIILQPAEAHDHETEISNAEAKARVKEMEQVVTDLQYMVDSLKTLFKADIEKKKKERGCTFIKKKKTTLSSFSGLDESLLLQCLLRHRRRRHLRPLHRLQLLRYHLL